MDLNEVIRAARPPATGSKIETICHMVQNQEAEVGRSQSRTDHAHGLDQSVGSVSTSREGFNDRGNSSSISQTPKVNITDDRSSSQRSSVSFASPVDSRADSHHACSAIGQDPSSGQTRVAQHRPLHVGRAQGDEDRFRQGSSGPKLSTHVGSRARVDSLVHPTLSRTDEVESSVGAQVRREADRAGRELESPSASLSNDQGPAVCQCDGGTAHSQESGQSKGDAIESQDEFPREFGTTDRHGGGRVRHASGVATAAASRRSDCDHTAGRCDELAGSNGQSGEFASAGAGSFAAKGSRDPFREIDELPNDDPSSWSALLAAGDIDGHDIHMNMSQSQSSPDRQRFMRALSKIDSEYQHIVQKMTKSETFPHRKNRMHLFEVFCSNQSRLVQQVEKLGGRAQRYSKDRTDLMTPEGRAVLFQDLLEHEPMHVWLAPECGPWSSWSNLNQSKSLQSWLEIQNHRWENFDQLALGVILLRHQRAKGHHLHWEQPNRSHMFQTPLLQEVFAKTIAAEFDMCNLGGLCDPENGKPMKKGMTVLTTSVGMQHLLHGHRCKGDHEHQALEGTTIYQGRRMNRTAFSENYPRKFARRVATFLVKTEVRMEKPWEWEKNEALASEVSGPQAKRRRITVQHAVRSRSHREDKPSIVIDENKPKCVRFHGKISPPPDMEPWRNIIEEITPDLPRVGKTEITSTDVVRKVQAMLGNQVVKSIVGGRAFNSHHGACSSISQRGGTISANGICSQEHR